MAISEAQYGPHFTPNQIEVNMELLLKQWFPDYLDFWKTHVSTDYIRGMMKPPANYTTRTKFDAIKPEELPKVVILAPGLSGQPRKSGRDYRATWRLGVGIGVVARSEEEADILVKVYGAIVRDIVMHHPSIGGIAIDTEWIDEQYNDIPLNEPMMQYKAASEWFNVDIAVVVQKYKGPKGVPARDATGVANKVVTEVRVG